MPRPSSIETLPAPILAQVDRMLADPAWSIDDVVEYLEQAEHPKSRSAVGRRNQKLQEASKRLRESRQITDALVSEIGDSAAQGKQGRLLIEMTRSLVFDLLQSIGDGSALDTKDVAFLGKGLAELSKALRMDQDFETKIRDEIVKQERAKAADDAGKELARKGLSKEQVQFWKKEFLGVKQPSGDGDGKAAS